MRVKTNRKYSNELWYLCGTLPGLKWLDQFRKRYQSPQMSAIGFICRQVDQLANVCSVAHLCFNVIIQLLLEWVLIPMHGECRLLVVYFFGSAFGVLGASTLCINQYILGASSGVFALLGAHCGDVIVVSGARCEERLRNAFAHRTGTSSVTVACASLYSSWRFLWSSAVLLLIISPNRYSFTCVDAIIYKAIT